MFIKNWTALALTYTLSTSNSISHDSTAADPELQFTLVLFFLYVPPSVDSMVKLVMTIH